MLGTQFRIVILSIRSFRFLISFVLVCRFVRYSSLLFAWRPSSTFMSSICHNCDADMIAAIQYSPNTTFTKITLGFLVLRFYWLELYKCFSLVLLVAVPLITYIHLVEPIIRVTKYCLERHPPQWFLSLVN